MKAGDVVVMPFAFSDGSCELCHEGLQTACMHGGFFGVGGEAGGAQAEAIRIPLADGTLFALDAGEDDELMPSLLTLSDVTRMHDYQHQWQHLPVRRPGRGRRQGERTPCASG